MEPTYKSYVLELLENSSHRLRQIELMRYEQQHKSSLNAAIQKDIASDEKAAGGRQKTLRKLLSRK